MNCGTSGIIEGVCIFITPNAERSRAWMHIECWVLTTFLPSLTWLPERQQPYHFPLGRRLEDSFVKHNQPERKDSEMLTSGVRQQIAHRGHPTLLVNVSRPHKRTQSNELQFQSLILNLEHLREELSLRCPDIRGGPLTWKTETKTNKQKKIT